MKFNEFVKKVHAYLVESRIAPDLALEEFKRAGCRDYSNSGSNIPPGQDGFTSHYTAEDPQGSFHVFYDLNNHNFKVEWNGISRTGNTFEQAILNQESAHDCWMQNHIAFESARSSRS